MDKTVNCYFKMISFSFTLCNVENKFFHFAQNEGNSNGASASTTDVEAPEFEILDGKADKHAGSINIARNVLNRFCTVFSRFCSRYRERRRRCQRTCWSRCWGSCCCKEEANLYRR
jgi:hypothetical protein